MSVCVCGSPCVFRSVRIFLQECTALPSCWCWCLGLVFLLPRVLGCPGSMSAGAWSGQLRRLLGGWQTQLEGLESSDSDGEGAAGGGGEEAEAEANIVVASARVPAEAASFAVTLPAAQQSQAQPFQRSLRAALHLARAAPADAEPQQPGAATALLAFFTTTTPTLHVSKEATAQLTGVAATKLEPVLAVACNALLHLERDFRSSFEEAIVSSPCRLVGYFETIKYDESPMKITSKRSLEEFLKASLSPGQDVAVPAAAADHGPLPLPAHGLIAKTKATSKLLQAAPKFAMLVQLPPSATDPATAGPYCVFVCSSLSWIQILERGTGPCIKTALDAVSAAPLASDHFAKKLRIATTDQHPSNSMCERLTLEGRDPTWKGIHWSCNVHIVARLFSKTLSYLESHISGLVNTSLYLGLASNMDDFRRSFTTVLKQKLVILRGAPPPQDRQRQDQLLSLLCSAGSHTHLRRRLLGMFLNGDWTRRDRVEVWVAPGLTLDTVKFTNQVVEAMLLVFTGRTFSTYPRHRWLGSDIAVEQLALMEAAHHLASQTFEHMCLGLPAHDTQEEAAPLPGPEAPAPPAMEADFVGQPGEPLHPVQAIAAGIAADTEPDSGLRAAPEEPEAGEAAPPTDFAAVNNSRRRTALQWLQQQPLTELLILRVSLQPLTHLLHTYITRSGQKWELQQRMEATDPPPPGEAAPTTRTAALEYLTLRAEHDFFNAIQSCLSTNTWTMLPLHHLTVSLQGLTFRIFSRMGALAHELLVVPTQKFPAKLLAAVHFPDTYPQFHNLCPKVFDDYSLDFLRSYPPEHGLSAEAKTVLFTTLKLSSVDIVNVEWLHGRVHRVLSAQKVQTHVPTIEYVNSQLLLQRVKLRKQASHQARGYWTSKQLRGAQGQADWAALAVQYRREKEQHTPAYQEALQAGSAATDLHQLTRRPSFGARSREIRRRAARATAPAHQPLTGPTTTVQGSGADASLQLHLEEALRRTRAESLQHSRLEARKRRSERATGPCGACSHADFAGPPSSPRSVCRASPL